MKLVDFCGDFLLLILAGFLYSRVCGSRTFGVGVVVVGVPNACFVFFLSTPVFASAVSVSNLITSVTGGGFFNFRPDFQVWTDRDEKTTVRPQ